MPATCPHCRFAVTGPDSGRAEVRCPSCGSSFRTEAAETGVWDPAEDPHKPEPVTPGQTVSHYEILERLGGGGMGIVCKARDTRLGRLVALKFLPERFTRDRQALDRFQREARTASALNHRHICTLYDVGEHNGQPFLVMELLEGQTLRERIDGRPVPVEELLELGVQLAEALDAAHAREVVHRDIKSANLFLSKGGQLKVLDFGLAKLVGRAGGEEAARAEILLSSPGSVMGTVAYMSPEQARGQELDARTDLFSCGVVLYEMATGQMPFEGSTTALVFDAILNRIPVRPRQLKPGLPADLEHIILKALEKDREVRYQTASDLRADLKRLKRDTESGRLPAAPSPVMPPAPRQQTAWLAIATAAVALLLLAGVLSGLIPLGRRDPGREQPDPDELTGIPRVTPFLADEAIRKNPAWSPAGNQIAFVSDEGGKEDVWICDVTGDRPINLTGKVEGAATHPAWSPRGDRIAFYSDQGGGGIWTMSNTGGSVRKLVSVKSGILYTFSLRWSKSGDIVYTSFDANGHKQVYRITEDNLIPECLTKALATSSGHFGEMSPAGDRLVFLSPYLELAAALYVGDLASGSHEELERGAGYPRWGPRGDRIYFLSRREGLADLWTVPVPKANRAARRLTAGMDWREFTFNPEGRKLIAVKARSTSRLWAFPLKQTPLTNLKDGKELTSAGFTDASPQWLRPGQELIFTSNRRGTDDVWKLTPEGGSLERLTTGRGIKYHARLSPDGRWLGFNPIEDRDRPHVMSSAGGKPHPLFARLPDTIKPGGLSIGSWSPDGTRLAVSCETKEGKDAIGIARFDPETGLADDLRVLNLPHHQMNRVCWAPNGKFLVYEAVSDGSWNLWITDAEGKDPRPLTSDPGNERGPLWSADGKWLYFMRDARAIMRMPMDEMKGAATGPAQEWARFPRTRIDSDGLALTKDQAVIAVTEEGSDLWLVEFPER